MPVGCDSIEPTDNFIRRPFTAISTAPRATTTVEISFMILLFWLTIRRSNHERRLLPPFPAAAWFRVFRKLLKRFGVLDGFLRTAGNTLLCARCVPRLHRAGGLLPFVTLLALKIQMIA
jgi:hypothetical protein